MGTTAFTPFETPPQGNLCKFADKRQATRISCGYWPTGRGTFSSACKTSGRCRGNYGKTESQRPNGMGQTNEQHPKPSYGDRKCRTDFRIRIYDQGRQGVPTLCRLFLYSQQLCKNIPSTAEALKPDGEQENQYTAHNPEAANNNCTWEFNAKPYYCCKQRTRDVVSDP